MSEETHSDEETESLSRPSPVRQGACVEQRRDAGSDQDRSPHNEALIMSGSPSSLVQDGSEHMNSVPQQSNLPALHKERHGSFMKPVADSVVPTEAGSGAARDGPEEEEPSLLGAGHDSQCVQRLESVHLSAAEITNPEAVGVDSSAKEGPDDVAVGQASGIREDTSPCGMGDQVDTSRGNEVEVQSCQANESAAPSSPERQTLAAPDEISTLMEDAEGKTTTIQQDEAAGSEADSKEASSPAEAAPKRCRKKARDTASHVEELMDDPRVASIDTITLPRLGPNGRVDCEGGLLEVSRYGRARTRPLSYWANERFIFDKEQGVLGVSSGSQCGDLVGSFGTPVARKRAKPTKRSVKEPDDRKMTAKKKGVEIADRKVVGGRKRAAGATGQAESLKKEDLADFNLEVDPKLKPKNALSAADPSGSDTMGLPPPAATTTGRKRGRPKGSKSKPKDNSNPMLHDTKSEGAVMPSSGLATLAAAAGSRAAAGAREFPGGTPESTAQRCPSSGFVSLDRPQRCGTCAACAAGDRPCETLSALRALVSTPSSAPKKAKQNSKNRGIAKRGTEDELHDAQAAGQNPRTPSAANQKPLSSTRGCKRSATLATAHGEQAGSVDDDWTAEQVSALKSAWLDLDPKKPGFWGLVAARVGRSADECSQRWYDSCPTPGPPANRGGEASRPALRLAKVRTSASAGAASSKATVQRVVKIARREARWETAAAAAERQGGAEAVAVMEEKRAEQAFKDRYIDQILRKRGGRAWSALVGNGGLIAAAVSSSEDRARSRLAEEDARRDVQAALARQQANASEDDDRDSNDESDYYWSDA